MAIGRLDALLCPQRQATWDAAYLPALHDLGCTVSTLDTGHVDRATVVGWLERVAPKDKPIPPFIVTTNAFDAEDDASVCLPTLSPSTSSTCKGRVRLPRRLSSCP